MCFVVAFVVVRKLMLEAEGSTAPAFCRCPPVLGITHGHRAATASPSLIFSNRSQSPHTVTHLPTAEVKTSWTCSEWSVCCWRQAVFAESGAALVWVSHDPGQPGRVGGRIMELPSGRESAVPRPEKV